MEFQKEYNSLELEIVYVYEDVIRTSNGGDWPWGSDVEDDNDFGQ